MGILSRTPGLARRLASLDDGSGGCPVRTIVGSNYSRQTTERVTTLMEVIGMRTASLGLAGGLPRRDGHRRAGLGDVTGNRASIAAGFLESIGLNLIVGEARAEATAIGRADDPLAGINRHGQGLFREDMFARLDGGQDCGIVSEVRRDDSDGVDVLGLTFFGFTLAIKEIPQGFVHRGGEIIVGMLGEVSFEDFLALNLVLA